MNKLSEGQIKQLAELTTEVRAVESNVENLRDEVNNLIASKLNSAIDEYNETLTRVVGFVDVIVEEMEDYANSKGGEWSESDAGSAYEDWKSEWEGLDVGELDRAEPIELDTNLADQLERIATEPNA